MNILLGQVKSLKLIKTISSWTWRFRLKYFLKLLIINDWAPGLELQALCISHQVITAMLDNGLSWSTFSLSSEHQHGALRIENLIIDLLSTSFWKRKSFNWKWNIDRKVAKCWCWHWIALQEVKNPLTLPLTSRQEGHIIRQSSCHPLHICRL